MTSEAARPIIFIIKSYPCMPKAGSYSIQGIPDKHANKFLCFISINIQYHVLLYAGAGPEHNTAKLYASARTRPLNSRPRALALAMYLYTHNYLYCGYGHEGGKRMYRNF